MFDNAIPMGDFYLGELPKRWRQVDMLYRLAINTRDTRDERLVDGRFQDEARPGGHRLYPSVERYLTAAHDCHAALPVLLREHGATQTAMWSLLRSQFEAAFYALWQLQPVESRDRVLRGVRVEWLSDMQSRKYFRSVLEHPFDEIDDAERRQQVAEHACKSKANDATYTAECAALGQPWRRPPDINVAAELDKISDCASPVLFRHVWRSLAGLQHGDIGALLRVSDKVVEATTAHGQIVRVSPSPNAFESIAGSVASLTVEALSRYQECHRPERTNGVVDLAHVALFRKTWNEA